MTWKAEDLEGLNVSTNGAELKRIQNNRKAFAAGTEQRKKKRRPNKKSKEKQIKPWPPFTSPQCKIGIDPAMRESGLAICIIDENKEAYFKTFKRYRDFQAWIKGDVPDNALVTIENSDLQNESFNTDGNKYENAAKGRKVGKNQGVSHCIVESCIERWGEDRVRDISPRQKGKKWEPWQFKAAVQKFKIKCFNRQGTQDESDALQLAVWEPRKFLKY